MKMRVIIERETKDYIHNDIGNAAHFLLKRAKQRFEAGDEEGIFLDWMACAVMIAFSVEADMNFIGWNKLGDAWDERQPTKAKVKQLLKATGVTLDWNKRPLSTLCEVWELRSTLAHGKPRVTKHVEEAVGSYDELYELTKRKPAEWETLLSQEFVDRAYADADEVYQLLLRSAGISLYESLSGGGSGMSFVRHMDEPFSSE